MPWYAQRTDLPDTHKHHADEGSSLARVYERLGYVQVPAPGAGEPEEIGAEVAEQHVDKQPIVADEPAAVEQPAEAVPVRRTRRPANA